MQVILLERIHRLGNIGDVVEVRNGYARNYLMPRNKVMRATPSNLELFERKRAEMEVQNAQKLAAAQKIADKLGELVIVMIRQAAEDGKLYGSVHAKELVAFITETRQVELPLDAFEIGQKIKSVGVYDIHINLHPELRLVTKLVVARNQESVDAMLFSSAPAVAEAEPMPEQPSSATEPE
ncbi:MAG: 50S ribosomal protein L9 [Proteobacteria bacterium]|nr:50S ribosomal protein L9 [Pseudomonadota bacterium]